jgi:hypothetical protein
MSREIARPARYKARYKDSAETHLDGEIIRIIGAELNDP